MTDYVGRGSTRAARRAPLFDYLKARHPRDVIPEGSSLRLASNRSVVVSGGYTGFIDFATGESGNAVDFLVRYLDYGFQDAVAALCEYMGTPTDLQAGYLNVRDLTGYEPPDKAARTAAGASAGPPAVRQASAPAGTPTASQGPRDAGPKPFMPPPPVQGPYRQLFAYLTRQRGIPAWLIQKLVDDGLLYQEAGHNNMVFIDPARTYAELRGTLTDRPFHGIVSGSGTAGFWWFKPQGPASTVTGAFICEAAIDSMSLYLIRQRLHLPPWDNPMYCSIGGVYNQQRIDAIKDVMDSVGKPTVIAVDNDDAGNLCRQRNPDCRAFVPTLKDWNADWLDALRQPAPARTS